jgi:hypothetical protein
MKHDTHDLTESLFVFAQAALSSLPQDAPPDFEAARTMLRQHRTLQAQTLATWPPATRAGVAALIKAMIMVMELDRATGGMAHRASGHLLDGTTPTRLGEPLVAEILAMADELESLYREARQCRQAGTG